MCGLASLQPTWSKLRADLLSVLLPLYFKPRGGATAPWVAVMKRLWQKNPKLLVDTCLEAYRSEETAPVVNHMLQIMISVPETQQAILNTPDGEFLAALASAAADRDQLNLETFLVERLNAAGANREQFGRSLLSLIHKHSGNSKPKATGESVLSVESMAVLVKILQEDVVLQRVMGAEVKQAIELCSKRYAEVTAPSSAALIEEMANSYFQKIYTSEQSIAEVRGRSGKWKATQWRDSVLREL